MLILYITITALAIQSLFWNLIFRRLKSFLPIPSDSLHKGISVIVCAKNEAKNLDSLIPRIEKQLLNTNSELIIIDDQSTDNTKEIVQKYCNSNRQIRYFYNSVDGKGKKEALKLGLIKAKNDNVLLTDADCVPEPDWVKSMSSIDADIVLGYSPYLLQSGFLNRWVRYEAVLTAIQYLSAALWNQAYMGVGRNLRYSKSLVLESNALNENKDLSSGDDDLIINKIATQKNVNICIEKPSWVYSKPVLDWKNYIRQKKRHYSTAHRYLFKHQVLLSAFSLSWIIVYFGIVVLLISKSFWIALGLILFRWVTTCLSVVPLFKKLGYSDGIKYWPILDVLTPIYFIFFAIFTIKVNKDLW